MISFNKGDLIIVVKNNGVAKVGMTGTVLSNVNSLENRHVPIHIDQEIESHSCDGLCSDNQGYHFPFDEIEKNSILQDFSNLFRMEKEKSYKDFYDNFKGMAFEDPSKKFLMKKIFKDTCFSKCNKDLKIHLIDNKELYPLIYHPEERRDLFHKFKDFMERLEIPKILFGPELPDNVNNWKIQEELTLYILPRGKNFLDYNQSTSPFLTDTFQYIQNNYNVMDMKNLNPISYDITTVYSKHFKLLLYLPTKNILILLVNPFNEMFVIRNLKDYIHKNSFEFPLRCRSKKEIEEFIYQEIWGKNLKKKINDKESSIRDFQNEIINIETKHQDWCNHIKATNLELMGYKKMFDKGLKKKLKDEIKKTKELPFVKNITLSHNIRIDLGKLYLTERIQNGFELKEDIRVPKFEMIKIYIGDMYIIIEDNKIKVHSKEKDIGDKIYSHPHVSDSNIPCFGDIKLKINQKLVELEIFELSKLLYSWIISYNEDDAHVKIDYFHTGILEDEEEDEEENMEF